MSIENNRALSRRIAEEIINNKNLRAVNELIDTKYVIHTTMGDFEGPEGFKKFLTTYFTAFPDIHQIIEEEIAEGDKVMFRQTYTGTHQGSLMGIPPTGKHINIQQMVVNRFAGGKAVESWALADMFSMMQQLGLIPPMGQR
jgi:predicted ester cyclase